MKCRRDMLPMPLILILTGKTSTEKLPDWIKKKHILCIVRQGYAVQKPHGKWKPQGLKKSIHCKVVLTNGMIQNYLPQHRYGAVLSDFPLAIRSLSVRINLYFCLY